MEEQRDNHYAHIREHPHSRRTVLRSLQLFLEGRHREFVAIANNDAVELYEKVGCSVVYFDTHRFMCDIAVMEVISSKGDFSDVLFVADQFGRFLFWTPTEGALSANNTIRCP